MNLLHPIKYLVSRWNKIIRIDKINRFLKKKLLASTEFYVNKNSPNTEELRNRAVKVKELI